LLDISVVICTFKDERWDGLSAAVESVLSQTVPVCDIVVVVDHNPALLERCRERWPDVAVVENLEAPGNSNGRNAGLAASRGAVVAFLDDDAEAAPDWLETLLRAYRDPAVLGAGGHVEPRWESSRPAWFPREFDWVVGCSYTGLPSIAAPVRNPIGTNMSFRREALMELRGFRSDFGHVGSAPLGSDETDLCIRMAQLWPEGKIIYDPAAVVSHAVTAERARLRYFLSRCWIEGRSKALLSRMVGARDALASERSYTRRTLPAGIGRGLRDAVRGDSSGLARAAAILIGLVTTASGYVLGSLRRRPAPPAPVGSSPLRVLMVTPRYPPDVGGVERHVSEVARRVAAMGAQVTVLCADRTGKLPVQEEREGVTLRRTRAWPAQRDYYFAPGIYREIVRGSWDLVHVQSYHTFVAPLAMLAALRCRTPYVVTFHGGGHSSTVRHLLRRAQRSVLRPLLARADRLVATAHFEIGLYGKELGLGPDRFVLIPNGGDLRRPMATAASSSGNGTVIASVGRLERYKGHHRAIAALPHVIGSRPDARLWIGGSGPYEEELRRQAKRLGLRDRVEIEAVPLEDGAMTARLGSAAVVVLLSDFETHPMAALEALALGRPLVVADTSGLRELAERGVARAVPVDSAPRALADAILAELERPPVKHDVSVPSWDECAGRLMDLYDTVATRRARCGS
jgi:glycosyltransferase involved in cell wall biosynthesis